MAYLTKLELHLNPIQKKRDVFEKINQLKK